MFEFIRTHQRLMQFLLLLIIVPSFAFVGLESYIRMSDREPVVAKVDGQDVSQREWDAAQARQLERFRQMFGDQFNPSMFDTPEARQGTLEGLLAQKALSSHVTKNNFTVSDDQLRSTILEIQGLTNPDGSFNKQRYQAMLSAQGMTPDRFEANLRHELAMQQVNLSIQNSAFASKTVAARITSLNQQVREVQELSMGWQDFKGQVKPTDAMVNEFYNKNSAQFEVPETVKIEYLVLSPEVVESRIEVSDADIKTFYDQNIARYKTSEQRRASHILINASKDASAADKASAKAKAEKILEQVRKNPADFAKLAKENSQDTVSAERGGDLNFFGKGDMVKPFEDSVFALKEGEISGLVQSDFGFHIIRVTGIKAPATRELAEVKASIAADIKRQQAGKKYSEMAEIFSNMVYEQSDSLKPVADKLGLKIESAQNLTRKTNPSLPKAAAYNQPKFLTAIFSDDAIRSKRNTEAIEVGSSVLIAGRVVEHKPVTKIPVSEVRPVIEERLIGVESEKLAVKAGEARLAELRGGSSADFGAAKSVSRNNTVGVSPAAVTAIMKVDPSKLPAYVGVPVAGRGYAIYRVNKINEDVIDEEARKAEQQQVDEFLAAQEMAAYLDIIKKRAKAEILKPVAAKSAPAAQ
jgi:peptidyl-prolyl cis-trans isomerase D